MADGHHIHHKLLQQEVWAVWAAVTLFFGYLGLSFFVEGTQHGIFGSGFSASDFAVQAWDVFVIVWRQNITPIFVILDILLIITGMYALVRVWPLKQGMTLFGLKPHEHGHDAHGGHGGAHGEAHAPAHGGHAPTGNPATLRHWSNIVHRANTGTPENLRWAVMEADALVDHVLKQRGMPGETFADRLNEARFTGSKIVEKVFEAHRLRNELAHTPGFQMSSHQAERALVSFRDFLKELKEF